MNPTRILSVALAGCLLSASVVADDKVKLLADDLEFAKDLARHRFFDLSAEVVGRAQKSIEATDDVDLAGEAILVEASIHLRRSENTSDTSERMAALSKAIERLEDFLGPGTLHAFHPRKVDAMTEVANALRERGKLHARLAAEGDAAARSLAAADFAAADKAYEKLQRECAEIADQLADNGEADAAEAMAMRGHMTYFLRGQNSTEWADVVDNAEFRLEQAIEQFDEFGWEVSDETLPYYEALFHQARSHYKLSKIRAAEGDTAAAEREAEDARDLLDSVLEQGGASFWDHITTGIPTAYRPFVAGLFAEVWGFLARMEVDAGQVEAGEKWIDTLITSFDEKGVPLGRRGHQTLLDWAETLEALGRSSQVTPLVNRVATEGRGTPEGERAEVLLSSLVRGAFVESPDVLMAVARGHFTDGRHTDAAFNFLRAASLATSDEDRRRFAHEAWTRAGLSLTQIHRDVEAALAFEEALKTAQELSLGPDVMGDSAFRMYSAFNRRFQDTGHPFDKQQRDAASERLIAMGYEGDLPFLKAQEAFDEVARSGDVQGYIAVKADFEAVPTTSPNYERALVLIGRCLIGMGQLDEAIQQFQRVEARADDPSLDPPNADARARREGTMAQSRYYHADTLLNEQVARPQDALAVLADFETDLASQENFHQQVRYLRVKAHCMANDVRAAEEALDTLVESGADATSVSSAAFLTARTLEQEARRLASDPAARPGEFESVLERAADAMWLFCEKSNFQRHTNVLATADWYLEAGEPVEAQRVYQRVIDVFANRAGVPASEIDRARIGVARSLDEQRDFGRARPVWKDLLARQPRDPAIRRGAARSFGGWLEFDDDGRVVEVPGSGDYAEAYAIWAELQRAAQVASKYHEIWWEAKLGTIYTKYRQRESLPSELQDARLLLDNLRLSTPEWDKSTIDLLEPEYRYEPLFWALFNYIDRQVPTK